MGKGSTRRHEDTNKVRANWLGINWKGDSMDEYLSDCCQAEVEVHGGTSNYYICSKCDNPCDATRVVISNRGDCDEG